MKTVSKTISLLLLLAIIVTSLSACGGSKNTATTNLTTINIWTGDSHSKNVMNELVDKYNQTTGKEKGINIIYTVKEGNTAEITDMAIASNQAPEIFQTGDLQKYSESGDIIAIEDMPGGNEILAKYDKEVLKAVQYNGKTYRLPFYVNTFGLVYNKEMFKKYGIVDEKGEAKPPKTYDELREYAKKMTNPSEKEYGIIMPLKWGGFFSVDIAYPSMRSDGIVNYDAVKGEYNFNGYKDILEMYMGIKADKSYFPGAEGMDNDPARAQFSEGKIGMKFAGSFDVGVYNTQFPAKMDWGVAPHPLKDINTVYKQRMQSDGLLVINKKLIATVGADKIMEVYKWFHSEEVLTKLYKEGLGIPYDMKLVKDIKLENPKKGWVEFAKLVDVSVPDPKAPKIDFAGEKNDSAVFKDEIWTGKTSVSDAITLLNERYNRCLKATIKANPNFNMNEYLVKEWNTKIK